jgi:DUF1680 family protein
MSRLTRRDMIQFAAAAATLRFAGGGEHLFASSDTSPSKGTPRIPERVREKFYPVPFEAQRLDGLLEERMRINLERRLLQVDQEALLSGFLHRRTGGDSDSYVGEHVGKFLDAACNTLRYREDAALRRIVVRMATQLIRTQETDGYLGTYPPENRWDNWDVWVHKYNLIGLLSYYELTGDVTALAACRSMGDLLAHTFGDAPGQRSIAAGVHVGMASTSVLEPMCWLYRFTGDPQHLEFCQYIVRAYERPDGPNIVNALLDHGSVYRTANGKAYEMLSNFNGLVDLYRLTGNEKLLAAVIRGWEDLVRHQLYFTGTTSAREHFQPPGQQLMFQASNVGETCVTVTWLQLNARLLRLTGEARFGQEIERIVYNHLLAAQNALTGDIAYYTSLVGYKEHTHAIFCCVSSGPRGLSLIPQLTWGLEEGSFAIHLYTSGHAHFEIEGVPVEIVSQTQFPMDGSVRLQLKPQRPVAFALKLRVPEWVTEFEAQSSHQSWRATPGQMLEIRRTWYESSVITVRMDLALQVKWGSAQCANCIALQRGPQVLALEKSVNPKVPHLAGAGLFGGSEMLHLRSVEGNAMPWRQVYEIDGATRANGSGALLASRLKLVPFADAQDYRVWITAADRLRGDTPPVTAYARADLSEVNLRLEPTDRQALARDIAEYLTDEDEKTFCTADPGKPNIMAQLQGGHPLGNRADPVWFMVMFNAPQNISRIVFQHGRLEAQGGWFDSSKGKPYVEVVRVTPPQWEQGSFVAFGSLDTAQWEKLAEIDEYPSANASVPPKLNDGQAFELKLDRPITIFAFRVVGHAGGDHASCAGLSAYA